MRTQSDQKTATLGKRFRGLDDVKSFGSWEEGCCARKHIRVIKVNGKEKDEFSRAHPTIRFAAMRAQIEEAERSEWKR